MTRMLASRVMRARRESTCPLCRGPVRVGQQIGKVGSWAHTECIIDRLMREPPRPSHRDSDIGETT